MDVPCILHQFITILTLSYLLYVALTKRKRPTADDEDLGEDLSGPWTEDKAESEAKHAKLASLAAAKEQEALPVEETYEETEYAENVHMQEPDEEAEKW